MRTINFGTGDTYEIVDAYARENITQMGEQTTEQGQQIEQLQQAQQAQPASSGASSDYEGVGFSCWEGKTAVCVGDSITAGSGTTTIYYNILKDLLKFSTVTGMGVAGSCVSAKSNYGNGNSPLINRYSSIPDKDLITIFMGTNDYGHETPMGTIADTTDVSFYGALNVIIPGILTAHPNSRLVWITPTRRHGFGKNGANVSFTYDWLPNNSGNTLGDYVNAIKEVCARYAVPIIDLYSQCGLQPAIAGIKSTYTADGLHPNAAGHNKMAVYMAKQLNLYSPYMPTMYSHVAVTGVSLNNSTLSMSYGSTQTLTATVSPMSASNTNVTWSVLSGDSVTITPAGLSCSVTAKSVTGASVVKVTTVDGGFSAQCTVNVSDGSVAVTGVSISGLDSISVGNNLTLTGNITPVNATNKTLTWVITSGSEYVTIDSNGITCTVTGVSAGSADISVSTQDGGFVAVHTVTVTQAGQGGNEEPSEPEEPTGEFWELGYGNRYSAAAEQQASHARLSSVINKYFHAGDVVTLTDNTTYKWQMGPITDETTGTFNTAQGYNWGVGGKTVWVNTKTYTIPSDNYYALALLYDDQTT